MFSCQVVAVLGLTWTLRRGGYFVPGQSKTTHAVLLRYFKRSPAGRSLLCPVTHLPMLAWDDAHVPAGASQRRRTDHVYDLVSLDSLNRRVCILPDFQRSVDPSDPDRCGIRRWGNAAVSCRLLLMLEVILEGAGTADVGRSGAPHLTAHPSCAILQVPAV